MRRLALVLGLTAFYAVAEVVGGWLANSLALLADAGHMLTDIAALGLALLAAWTAQRPPDQTRTYGYQRIEILAALSNGVILVVIALVILFEAWARLRTPPPVDSALMALVAAGGLLVNLVAARILGGHRDGLNARAAYLHVLGDLLGSVGALLAAGAIAAFGWRWADPAASVAIGLIIVVSAVRLVLESANVLLEGAPSHLRTEDVRDCLRRTPGVCDVHDLHLWSLGGASPLLTAHLVLDHSVPGEQVLREATGVVRERFGIVHSTLQIEPPDYNIVLELTGTASSDPSGP
jgi:cobalt-zinc-cadmium efflux system protein